MVYIGAFSVAGGERMRVAWIPILIMILSSTSGLAVPIESVPQPEIIGSDQTAAAAVQVPPRAKIPDSPVHMFIRQGSDSRFELFFLDVRYGYDLVDFEFYKAWCLQNSKPIRRNAMHKIRLYNCYDPDLPPELKGIEWNQINYIINHKRGSKEAIQQAIWHFTNGGRSITLKGEAAEIVEEANLKGSDYKPADGEFIAVVCLPDEKKQPVFIEYKIPEAAPLDVAPAVFVPPMAPAGAGMIFPAWIPLLPIIPIVPLIPSGPDSPPSPPTTPVVPEPCSFLLLASGIAGIAVSRIIGRRIKRPWT